MFNLIKLFRNSEPSDTASVHIGVTARRWALLLLVSVTPIIVSALLVSSRHNISSFTPEFNDEISYWHQILTFKEVGFNGGYYSYFELAPPAEFTHFYTYGPWYPMLYGILARIIGWDFVSLLILNSLLVSLSLLSFCWFTKLSGRQLWITAVMVGSFWGFLMFLFSGMQEPFQQALAILLAAVFYRALAENVHMPYTTWLIGLAIIALASLTRLSWAILFLPYLILTGRKQSIYRLAYIILSLILVIALSSISNFVGAPGNNSVFKIITGFSVSIESGLQNLVNYFGQNLANWYYSPLKKPTDYLQTFQVMGLLILFIAMLISGYRFPKQAHLRSDAAFHLFNLGGILVASFALYIVGGGGDYRVVATHLMLTLLLLIARRQYLPVGLVIISSLLLINIFFVDYYEYIRPKYNPDRTDYQAFKTLSAKFMPYDPQATNAWCNTVLFPQPIYSEQMLLGVPAGIGYSFFSDLGDPRMTFKSRYLLLDPDTYRLINQRPDAPQLEWLADAPSGSLYLNRSADCPATTSQ